MNQKTRQEIIDELDKSSIQALMGMLGVYVGFLILFCAVFLSYKIVINLQTEHQGFAVIVGIPFNCLLYYLVYQCFQLKNGKFQTDDKGEADWVVGEKNVLPNLVWKPIQWISTAFVFMVFLWSVLAFRLEVTLYLLVLLCWLHYDTLKKRSSFNTNYFWNIIQYLVMIPKIAYLIVFIASLIVTWLF